MELILQDYSNAIFVPQRHRTAPGSVCVHPLPGTLNCSAGRSLSLTGNRHYSPVVTSAAVSAPSGYSSTAEKHTTNTLSVIILTIVLR